MFWKTGVYEILSVVSNFLRSMNHARYKQCVVTPHFSNGQILSKKILKKYKYWQKLLKKIEKR